MDKTEFEAQLRRDGFRPVFASLQPNMKETNHCHDFDARLLVLGGDIDHHARQRPGDVPRRTMLRGVRRLHAHRAGWSRRCGLSVRPPPQRRVTRRARRLKAICAVRVSRSFTAVKSPTSPKRCMRTATSTCASWF